MTLAHSVRHLLVSIRQRQKRAVLVHPNYSCRRLILGQKKGDFVNPLDTWQQKVGSLKDPTDQALDRRGSPVAVTCAYRPVLWNRTQRLTVDKQKRDHRHEVTEAELSVAIAICYETGVW
jgi:hypothetical protein